MLSFVPPELEEFRLSIRKFAENSLEKNAYRWDENEEFPLDSYKAMAEEGILGLGIPEKYGGTDPSKIKEIVAAEEVGRVDINAATQIELKSLYEHTVLLFGSEEQKKNIERNCIW